MKTLNCDGSIWLDIYTSLSIRKLNLANFVEDEAELSGSEADSDENYDAEDDDEEIEGIINEEVGDEDELRDQVNKVHL